MTSKYFVYVLLRHSVSLYLLSVNRVDCDLYVLHIYKFQWHCIKKAVSYFTSSNRQCKCGHRFRNITENIFNSYGRCHALHRLTDITPSSLSVLHFRFSVGCCSGQKLKMEGGRCAQYLITIQQYKEMIEEKNFEGIILQRKHAYGVREI